MVNNTVLCLEMAMRLAGQKLLDKAFIHDLGESALMAGLITVPQAFQEDADGASLAMQAGAGIGAAMATRPIARKAGRAVGRQVDQRRSTEPFPTDLGGYGKRYVETKGLGRTYLDAMANIFPGSRHAGMQAEARIASDYARVPEILQTLQRPQDPIKVKRARALNSDDAGRPLTGAEADIGFLAGALGDNIAQLMVQSGVAQLTSGGELAPD